jgi:hypothetical protein
VPSRRHRQLIKVAEPQLKVMLSAQPDNLQLGVRMHPDVRRGLTRLANFIHVHTELG